MNLHINFLKNALPTLDKLLALLVNQIHVMSEDVSRINTLVRKALNDVKKGIDQSHGGGACL